eukprot:6431612-Ditylum_brightwellii.AAC.1
MAAGGKTDSILWSIAHDVLRRLSLLRSVVAPMKSSTNTSMFVVGAVSAGGLGPKVGGSMWCSK